MTFNNWGMEKLTIGSDDSLGQEHFLKKTFSYNAGMFKAIQTEKSSIQKTSSCSISDMSQKNPNLIELVSGSSRCTETSTSLVFSFWTEPKNFYWNFNLKYRRTACQEERNDGIKKIGEK